MNAVHSLYRTAITANTHAAESLPIKFATIPTSVCPAIANQMASSAQSFSDRLAQIDTLKGKFREAKYQLVSCVYAACHTGYKNKSKGDIEANDLVLSKKCKELNIDGRTYYQKLSKLAFGNDSKRASSIVHVIKVAEMHSIEPNNFVAWLKKEGGIQKIRTKYNVDGTIKKNRTMLEVNPKKECNDDQYYIEKAKEALNGSIKASIPSGQLDLIEALGNEAECTAILRQCPDGSFVVKFVLSDQGLVDSLYAAHGKSNIAQDVYQIN